MIIVRELKDDCLVPRASMLDHRYGEPGMFMNSLRVTRGVVLVK